MAVPVDAPGDLHGRILLLATDRQIFIFEGATESLGIISLINGQQTLSTRTNPSQPSNHKGLCGFVFTLHHESLRSAKVALREELANLDHPTLDEKFYKKLCTQ